jgi:UTP--glucose-1-phosphate uridylyltransferase
VKRPRKVVFPLAAPGSRAHGDSMNGRVEMIPVVDKPMIQYATEEALAAGFTEFIFVTGPSPRTTGFDGIGELDAALELRGRTELVEAMRAVVPDDVNCVLIRQPLPLGPAHAVLCARPVVGDEPFAVVLADQLIEGDRHALADMVDQYESYRCSIVGARALEDEESAPRGVLRCGAQLGSLFQVAHFSERAPAADEWVPLVPVGRAVFTPGLMTHLQALCATGTPGVRLRDAIALLLRHETVLAWSILARHLETLAKGTGPCVESSALSPSAT